MPTQSPCRTRLDPWLWYMYIPYSGYFSGGNRNLAYFVENFLWSRGINHTPIHPGRAVATTRRFVSKYFVVRFSTTKTTKILPLENYPLYGIHIKPTELSWWLAYHVYPPLAYHVYPPLTYHVYPQADPDPCVRERSEFRESLLDGFSRCVPNVLKDIAQSSTTRPAPTNQKTATRGQSVLYTT